MPMLKGSSPKIISKNISEFHGGKTYAHTAAKFGTKKANAQAVAAAMSTARRYGKKYAEGGDVEDEGESWVPPRKRAIQPEAELPPTMPRLPRYASEGLNKPPEPGFSLHGKLPPFVPEEDRVNQPRGELSEAPAPTPIERTKGLLQRGMTAMGAEPYRARHMAEGLTNVGMLYPPAGAILGGAELAHHVNEPHSGIGETLLAAPAAIPGMGPIGKTIGREGKQVLQSAIDAFHTPQPHPLPKVGTPEHDDWLIGEINKLTPSIKSGKPSPAQLDEALESLAKSLGIKKGEAPKPAAPEQAPYHPDDPSEAVAAIQPVKDYNSQLKSEWDKVATTEKEMNSPTGQDFFNKEKENYSKSKEKMDADDAEYWASERAHEAHEAKIHSGNMEERSAPHLKTPAQSEARFDEIAKPIKDWSTWTPHYSHEFVPMDFPNAMKHPGELGFNPKVPIFKGGHEYYSGELKDPSKKGYERAWFAAHHKDVAKAYHSTNSPDTYVAKVSKGYEVNWPDFNGGYYHYSGIPMEKLIEAAHAKGADFLAIHNIVDVAKGKYAGEPHTQYAFLKTSGEDTALRNILAKFNPDELKKGLTHAGLAGGGLFTYGALSGSKNEDSGMKRGGPAKMALGGYRPSQTKPVLGMPPPLKAPHTGMIHSDIPGRTDKIGMTVTGGSYVLPSDVVSGIGQGNSMAGASALNKLFGQGPYGSQKKSFGTPKVNFGHPLRPMLPMRYPRSPSKFMMNGMAEGGEAEEKDENGVPIIAAGGEWVVPPEVVLKIGGGNMKHGHEVLDHLVLHIRRKTIHEMRHLKPPKK